MENNEDLKTNEESIENKKENIVNEASNEELKTEQNFIDEKLTEENTINEQNNEKSNDIKVEKVSNELVEEINKKSSKKPIIIIGIILVLLATIILFGYKMLFNSKQIFLNSVNKSYKELENFIDDTISNNKKDIKTLLTTDEFSINAKLNESLVDEETQNILDEINKTKIKTQIGYDLKNKEMLFDLNSSYNNKELLNLSSYMQKQNMYLDLKKLFDKYIEIPIDNYDELFKENNDGTEDLKYVLSTLKNSIINNLDEKEFKKQNKTIKVNGKEVKTTKISYGLSEKNTNELAKKVLTELKNNKKFISKLATLTGKEEKYLNESIEKELKEINENLKEKLDTKEEIIISTYVKGITKQNVGFELNYDDSKEKYSFTYFKEENIKELTVYNNDKKIVNMTYSNNKMVIKIEDSVEITVEKTEEKNTKKYTYEANMSGATIKGEITNKTIKEDKNSKEAEYKIEAKLVSSGMELASLVITGKSTSDYNAELSIPEIKNKINYKNLTEEDLENIENKLMENEGLKELMLKLYNEEEISL